MSLVGDDVDDDENVEDEDVFEEDEKLLQKLFDYEVECQEAVFRYPKNGNDSFYFLKDLLCIF